MSKLLLTYLRKALTEGLGYGLGCAVIIAWIPLAIWLPSATGLPVAVLIVVAFRVIMTILFLSFDNVPETIFSLFRLVVVALTTYFVGAQMYNLVGGYWGRFLAILCAVLASMIAHGVVVWVADIFKGPPYSNYNYIDYPAPSSSRTEEYLDKYRAKTRK